MIEPGESAEAASTPLPLEERAVEALLQVIYERRHYDFRSYARASLRRRLSLALTDLRCQSLHDLENKILSDDHAFGALVRILTVPVSEMFRDPPFFSVFREQVVPELKTYPSLKLWVAGCSSGEEVYSLAIVLAEERLLDRCFIYATDINEQSLGQARAGVYPIDRMKLFSDNYFKSKGKHSLSRYYTAAYGGAVLARSLTDNVVFSDHSLATDSVFSEVQVVSCRNVMIYFDRTLQDRVLGLFRDALARRGFLGLGSKETVRFSSHAAHFSELPAREGWFRRC
ncbi:MAG TPA: protein-glutamate O-methyltransferase CheR [Polyangiaceae bacterium]|nr:protein-glutamate O-methyltransferase CheR [Polyangiaceae bacterium]